MKTNLSRVVCAALLLSGSVFWSGCYATTIHSGKPAGVTKPEYDGKWHHGALWGIAEISGPYDLKQACPEGWSSIKTKTGFLNGVLESVTSSLYTPQTVTIECASGQAAASTATVQDLDAPK